MACCYKYAFTGYMHWDNCDNASYWQKVRYRLKCKYPFVFIFGDYFWTRIYCNSMEKALEHTRLMNGKNRCRYYASYNSPTLWMKFRILFGKKYLGEKICLIQKNNLKNE